MNNEKKILPPYMTPIIPLPPGRPMSEGQRSEIEFEERMSGARATIDRMEKKIRALETELDDLTCRVAFPRYSDVIATGATIEGNIDKFVLAAATKHPGSPPRVCESFHRFTMLDKYENVIETSDLEQLMKDINDAAQSGSWQTAILEEAFEFVREEDPKKALIELFQLIAVCIRAIPDILKWRGDFHDEREER